MVRKIKRKVKKLRKNNTPLSLPDRLISLGEMEEIEGVYPGPDLEIPEGLNLGKPFVTLRAGTVASRLTGEEITNITPDFLAELVRVYKDRKDSDPVIIDWNHNTSPYNGEKSTPENGISLGEIVGLELTESGDALIAIPAYSEYGIEIVKKSGGSLWSSPEFLSGGEVFDRESGDSIGASGQLLAITLTPRAQQTATVIDRVTLTEDLKIMFDDIELPQNVRDYIAQMEAKISELTKEIEALQAKPSTESEELAEEVPTIPAAPAVLAESVLMTENQQLRELIVKTEARVSAMEANEKALLKQQQILLCEKAVEALINTGKISPAEQETAKQAWEAHYSGAYLGHWEALQARGEFSAVTLKEIGHNSSAQKLSEEEQILIDINKLKTDEGLSHDDAFHRVMTGRIN